MTIRAGRPALVTLLGVLALPAPSGAGSFASASRHRGLEPEAALEVLRGAFPGRGVPLPRAERNQTWRLRDGYQSRHSGLTHLYLHQMHRGIEVSNVRVSAHVTPDGRLLSRHGAFIPRIGQRVNATVPELSAAAAVARAVQEIGLGAASPSLEILEMGVGPERSTSFSAPGISLDPIRVELAYLARRDGNVRLSWRLRIRTVDGLHLWGVHVDALSGTVLEARDRVSRDSYRFWPPPLESPDAGPRALWVDPADPGPSPFGWHDNDGASGAEFDDTQGNNIETSILADGGPSRVFDFPIDLADEPNFYVDAAATNAFAWGNFLHDVAHFYGFDEASGNFQVTNYTATGTGGDLVRIIVQPTLPANAALFITQPEGSMSIMLLGQFRSGRLNVGAPGSIAGEKAAGVAAFGPLLDPNGVAGTVVAALDPNDAAGPSTQDACSALTNPGTVAGKIALIDSGSCDFIDKVLNAEAAGAIGAIVTNLDGEFVLYMIEPFGSPPVSIPSLSVGLGDGAAIRMELGTGVQATLLGTGPRRDASLDGGVIAHEYFHGMSSRLTGGPADTTCLDSAQSEGMGEGWSDFWSLALTAKTTDQRWDPRGIANYLMGQPPGEKGLRNHPYTPNLFVNSKSLLNISTANFPHGVGEVWGAALWDAYWNLVDQYGFDPDLYLGAGGNNLALQLVVDGLKLQPCDPTFLEARDAILQADVVASGGSNRCLLWKAFARRGMGDGALDGGDANSLLIDPNDESFEVPSECAEFCGDADDDGVVDSDDVAWLRQHLADPSAATPAQLLSCQDHAATGACDVLETAILWRTLAGQPPGIGETCQASAPL